jgi:hypothetical protein
MSRNGTEIQVTIATNYLALTHLRESKLLSTSKSTEKIFLVYRVYSVNTHILMWRMLPTYIVENV